MKNSFLFVIIITTLRGISVRTGPFDGAQKNSIQTGDIISGDTGIKLIPHHIRLQKGVDFDLNIPEGYNISIAGENLHRLRFLAKSPDGKLFGTDMYNMDDNRKGKIYILD